MYLVELYLEELSKVRDKKTIERISYQLAKLEELKPLDQRSLFEFYEELRKTQSHRTAIQTLQEIRRFYHWLFQKGYHYEFSEQAFRELKKKKEFENSARKYFTEEEVEKILSYIRTKPKPFVYYLLCVVLLSSGLRISEALSLKKDDFRERRLITEKGEERSVFVVKVKGKFAKEREVPLVLWKREWEEVIRKQLDSLKEGQAFFTYSLRFPKSVKVLTLSRDAVYRFFFDLSKELGIDVHPHRFRYTYAVWLAMKNIPPNVLKEFLGHSSIRTTLEVYAQAQKEKVLDLIANL
jgi:integrase